MDNMKKRIKFRKFPVVICLLIGAVIMAFPFLWAVSVSLQNPGLAFVNPPKFFTPPYKFDNYKIVFQEIEFLHYSLNSLFIAALCIIGQIVSNSFIAFGFAKYKFKGSSVLFFAVLCTMMIPGNILSIPRYIMWHKVGGLDTYFPLTVQYFFGDAFNIFLLRQCFLGMPGALYEAATIDGASPPRIFAEIYMPLARATIITVAVTTFINCWNNMFDPLIYITTKSKYTIALALVYIKGKFEYNLELLMASSILAMLPVVIVYFFAQKHFVQGLTSAAVKG